MYKNYFYLNRLITELNELLRGFILLEAFSQERDKLILDFLSSDGDHRFIIISVSQNEPYILLKNDYHRAKKNSISFFRNRLPITLNSVEIATDDRIIKFGFNDCSLFFAIRGKDTNIILLDKDTVHEEFKKISELTEAKLLKDIQGKQYSPYLHKPYFEKNTRGIDFRLLIKDNFPFISKDILSEVYFRAGNKNDFNELCDILSSVIDEIHNEKISVFYDLRLNKVIFAPATFRIYDRTEDRLFETYLSAINDFLIAKYRLEKLIGIKNRISKYIEQQSEKLSNKLNQIKYKLDSPSQEEIFRNYGNLLLANIYHLNKGMKEVILDSFYDAAPTKIKLDETLDPKGNAEAYFGKARNEKQSRIYLSELYNNLIIKYSTIQEIKNTFQNATKLDDYINIMEKLNINDNPNANNPKGEKEFNFKHYIIENKYHVFVGRDSHNNDVLTVKFAKQNDYWFHARGVPGSHVVLRVESTKEAVPKSVLKKAASIAAFHSKAKTSKMAPVAFAFKKYVTKKKGMEPGKVSLQREEVLLVPPEIPQGCEFLED